MSTDPLPSTPKNIADLCELVNKRIEEGLLEHRRMRRKGAPVEIVCDLGPLTQNFRNDVITKLLRAKYSIGRSLYATHDILFDLGAPTHWIELKPPTGGGCNAQFIKIVFRKIPIE